MRVMRRSISRKLSGAHTMVFWIICSAMRRAATAVFRQALKTRNASIIPSRLFGVTVRIPANAACAAFWASKSSFLPRRHHRRAVQVLVGVDTPDNTANCSFLRFYDETPGSTVIDGFAETD